MNANPVITIIPVHSSVDFISNSSSEVFIGSSNLSIKAIKQAIRRIAIEYNKQAEIFNANLSEKDSWNTKGLVKVESLWTYHLKNPEVCPYKLLGWKRKGYYNMPMHDELAEHEKNRPEWSESVHDETYKKAYNIWREEEEKISARVYAEERDQAKVEIASWLQHHCLVNNIDYEEFAKQLIFNCYGRNVHWGYAREYDENDENIPFSDFVKWLELSYIFDVRTNKNDIIIKTQGDNTLPHDFFESINFFLNGTNYHIG
jgi:hypothetical protein